MLNRPDWEQVLAKYPRALENCRDHFQEKFREDWRNAIRRPEYLWAYFQSCGLEVRLDELETDWSFQIRLPWGRLQKGGWSSREDCEREALFTAFKELDLILKFRPS